MSGFADQVRAFGGLALRRAEATFRAGARQVAREAMTAPADAEAAEAAIADARPWETLALGVTGDNARKREYADGAVRLAAQRWQTIVAETAVKG